MDRPSDGAYRYETRTSTKIRPDHGSALRGPDTSIDNVCIAWRKGLKRALGLPYQTHSALLARVTGTLPLMDELLCGTAMFVSKCLTSDNSMVNFVARHGVYVLRQNSPVGSNATRFGLRLDMLKHINRNLVSRRVSTELHLIM